jgi:S-DNA-T family DNA segregation ATPase FtsK/SpoIIIE
VFRELGRRIDLRGYSHVFGHAPPEQDGVPPDSVVGVKETRGLQEVFGPDSLRAILRRYYDRQDPTNLRGVEVGPQAPPSPPAPSDVPLPSGPAEQLPAGTPPTAAEPQDAAEEAPASPVAADAPVTHLLRLLEQRAGNASAAETEDAAWLDDVASRTRNALLRYGMSARLEHKVLTPNAALLKFRGSDELTVAAVERRRVELETTHGLEVLSVRAEPSRVAISIRRPQRQVLTLAQVWRGWRPTPDGQNARLLIALKEDDAQPLFLEPEPAPHTLVAGSTGSGKSVLVQNILLGIAATNKPEAARIVLIDPKAGVDYFPFEPLPHLGGSIIDTTAAALDALEALVVEMERRYTLFKAARVSNIRTYNQKADAPLRLIWLVHDEFADWMQIDEYRAGVEAAVTRLGLKARAAGIYLIFAAQRPDATVFPMQLRSNLGNRLILRVDSAGTSDLSLGVRGGGAERLLGKGHLAAILGGGTEPIYAQVPFVGEDELTEYVRAICADIVEQ